MSKNKTTTFLLLVVVAALAAVGAFTALGTFAPSSGTFATPAYASYGNSGADNNHENQGEETGNN